MNIVKKGQSWSRSLAREFKKMNDQENKAQRPFGAFEWGVVFTATLGLIAMNFLGTPELYLWFTSLFEWHQAHYWELGHLTFWVAACVIGYLIIPLIYLRLCRRAVGEYYLSFKWEWAYWRAYCLLFIAVSIPVVIVSFTPDFQSIYPFYTQAGRSVFDLIAWELVYGVQFFALEFFFRAFMLQGLRHSMGFASIAMMIIPYCMIHFPKTAAESVGSVIAGLILGVLAMRSRSIWGGVALHWAVAIEMDLLCLAHKGQLFSLF